MLQAHGVKADTWSVPICIAILVHDARHYTVTDCSRLLTVGGFIGPRAAMSKATTVLPSSGPIVKLH